MNKYDYEPRTNPQYSGAQSLAALRSMGPATKCHDKEYTWWFLQKEKLLMPRPFYLLHFI